MELAVYCADIGSIAQGNFGWAGRVLSSSDSISGTAIEDLAAQVCKSLGDGVPVALGFECPLFVPHPLNPVELTRARRGESSRPWSAGAGLGSLATGLTETAWILSRVHETVTPEPTLFLSWPKFEESGKGLLLWEAFVTGSKKGTSHEADAVLAVEAFLAALPDPSDKNLIHEPQVFSLIAASALRAGWASAAALIGQPCLVLAT